MQAIDSLATKVYVKRIVTTFPVCKDEEGLEIIKKILRTPAANLSPADWASLLKNNALASCAFRMEQKERIVDSMMHLCQTSFGAEMAQGLCEHLMRCQVFDDGYPVNFYELLLRIGSVPLILTYLKCNPNVDEVELVHFIKSALRIAVYLKGYSIVTLCGCLTQLTVTEAIELLKNLNRHLVMSLCHASYDGVDVPSLEMLLSWAHVLITAKRNAVDSNQFRIQVLRCKLIRMIAATLIQLSAQLDQLRNEQLRVALTSESYFIQNGWH